MEIRDKDTNLIYLMGSGRSGSTILSVILGDNEHIETLGELHHLHHILSEGKECSCGKKVAVCPFWGEQLKKGTGEKYESANLYDPKEETKAEIEKHKYILPLWLGIKFKKEEKLVSATGELLHKISSSTKTKYLLDSSKYIARYLLMKRMKNTRVKSIFLVRDLRGVVLSFKKKVQTSQSPLKTIIYYLYVNMMGELVYLFGNKQDIIKVRYEDFMNAPDKVLVRLEKFLEVDFTNELNKMQTGQDFAIPHFIGGNRLVKADKIKFKGDKDWRTKLSTMEKFGYYLIALPINILNGYRL